ncbi:MAG TPA: Rid family hydrolase [Anaerolineae bacterium]
MALERMNPPDVYQPYNNYYTQVIRSTGTTQVHVAGTIALDLDHNLIGEDDMVTQVRVTMENIGKLLAAAGAKPSDVARINIYTLDVDTYRRDGHPEVLKFFNGDLPVSTLIGVTRLADPRFLVEIQVTAILD